jgi:prefoldin subunit 5
MGTIIFLKEIYESKRLKQQELEYYKQQMEMLQERMNLVQREIRITDTIIHIIEQEMK